MNWRRTFSSNYLWAVLLCFGMALPTLSADQNPAATSRTAEKNLPGVWEFHAPKGVLTLILNPNGSGEFNGGTIQWTFSQNVLSISDQGGTVMYNASVTSNSLTLSGAILQAPITFRRTGTRPNEESPTEPTDSQSTGGLGAIAGGTKPSGPTGTWQVQNANGTFTMVLNPDGSGRFNKDKIHWEYNQGTLTLKWENGDRFMYIAKLSSTSLSVSGGNLEEPINFRRVGPEKKSGGLRVASDDDAPAGISTHASSSGPAGEWEVPGPNGVVHMSLKPDGSGQFGGGSIQWSYSQKVLSITGPNGNTLMYNASLGANTMTLSGAGLQNPLTFRRSGSDAGEDSEAGEMHDAGNSGLVGKWQGQNGALQLNPDGSAIYNGTNLRYTVQGDTLTFVGADGEFPVPYTLSRNTLMLTIQGQQAKLTRMTGSAGSGMSARSNAGSNPPAMAGQWCYYAGTNSGQIVGGHQQCFTLQTNGTFTYFSNFDSTNQYGGASSSGSDQGTWSVNGSSLAANSQKNGVIIYQLELKNNKNNDPMICLNGECFATATQKAP